MELKKRTDSSVEYFVNSCMDYETSLWCSIVMDMFFYATMGPMTAGYYISTPLARIV